MDPITTAIVAALTSAVATSAPKAAEKIIADAYEGLKALIRQKLGDHSEAVKAIEGVETKPDSAGRRETLKEEIVAAQLSQDPAIMDAAQSLLDRINLQPGGTQHIQNIVGNYNAQADRGSTASVNVNLPKD